MQGGALCVVGGLSTRFCVLTAAMDAVCHDFKAVLPEDGSTAYTVRIHEQTIDCYRRNALYPLLRAAVSSQLASELTARI